MRYLIIILTLGLFIAGCERKLNEFQDLVKQLDEAEKDIRTRQEEMRRMVREYNAAHPEGSRIDTTSIEMLALDPEQAETLNRMLNSEKDVSYRGLLEEIVATRRQIGTLQKRIRALQEQLPAPYTVQPGDTHYSVSMRFLMENHGLTADEAHNVVEKTALVEELHPGFQIWMLYQDGLFGTYVTQGTAPESPGRAQRRARERIARTIQTLTGERDMARTKADSLQELQDNLAERILFLQNEESRLLSEIAALQDARDEALARIEISEQQRRELETRLNSVFYEVETKKRWEEMNVIDDPLFGGPRVKSLTNVAFSKAHDLRESDTLVFEAGAFPPLKQIKRIDLFPRSFKYGEEYIVTLEADGARASVTFLKPEAFAGQKIIFAVR